MTPLGGFVCPVQILNNTIAKPNFLTKDVLEYDTIT